MVDVPIHPQGPQGKRWPEPDGIPADVIQQRIVQRFQGQRMVKERLVAAAEQVKMEIIKTLGVLDQPVPEKMLVRYDADLELQSVHFHLYVTDDGAEILREMGFDMVFTMNAGAQARMFAATTNTNTQGLA